MSKSGSKIREQVAHFLVDIHILTLMNIKENWVFLFKNLRRTGSCPLQRKDLRRIRE